MELVRAMLRNACEMHGRIAKTIGGEVLDKAGCYRVTNPIPLRLLNGMFFCDMPEDICRAEAVETRNHYQQRGLPFEWWGTSCHQPANLSQVMADSGYEHFHDLPTMVLEMDSWQKPALPAGFEIRILRANNELIDYCAALAGFGFNEELMERFVQIFQGLGAQDPDLAHLVGYENGHPVCCGSVLRASGVAGIYCITTIAEFRGKGYGSAITAAAAEVGRSLGCDRAVLQSSMMGYPVYKKLGFKDLTTVTAYVPVA